jgi:hypothetical protein
MGQLSRTTKNRQVQCKLFLARAFRALISLGPILLVPTICSASRITGTYVAHGADFAEMLQLAQTDNGQLSGVFTSVQLKPKGNITSDQNARDRRH